MKIDTLSAVIGAAAAVLALSVPGTWFLKGLNSRVDRLEEQVHSLTIAPTIANSAHGSVSNPIAEACANLAMKAANEASASGSAGVQMESEQMLEKLGCVKPDADKPN